MAKGRKTIEFDTILLQRSISQAEQAETFPSRDALYTKAIELYRAAAGLNGDKLTNALVYQRVTKLGLIVNTPMGKKGRAPGTKISKQEKKAPSPNAIKIFAVLEHEVKTNGFDKDRPAFNEQLSTLLTKVKKGSLKARVKLGCLQCSNYQKEEIKNCQVFECVWHEVRPYKNELVQLNTEVKQ